MSGLGRWPLPLKLFVSMTLLLLLAGYALSLVLEYQRTGFRAVGFSGHLRGDGQFAPPMETETMVAATHPHLATVPLMLTGLALPFLLGRKPGDREKLAVAAGMYGGLAMAMGAHWLVRYFGPSWYGAFVAGGALLTISCIWAPLRALHEMWSQS